MTANRHSIFYGVDLWTVLLYVLIVLAGWVSITSASYDEGAADLFSFSHFYMKQLLWIGVAWVTALVVLLLDERFYHMFAYPAYLGGIALLLAALLFGPGAGFAVGAVADIIGGVLAGYAINPLITLGAGAIGLVAGYVWQKLPDYRTGLRLSISVLLGHFVGSMVINSLALRIFYGYAWSVLLARIPNALVLSAVNTVLLRILLENRSLMKLAKK